MSMNSNLARLYRLSRLWRSVSGLKRYNMSAPPKYTSLPKVELHVHGDGACRLRTLQELSQQHGCPYPHHDLQQFREVVSLPTAAPSLKQFLSVFGAIANILRTKESLERVAYEFCEDSAEQNVVYAEYRFNPYPDLEGACEGEEYCEGVFAGLAKGQEKFGIKVRCILCFKRETPERVMDIMNLAEKYCGQVVGVDIAGDELRPLDPRHVAGFQKAKQLGLHVTVHAAESGPASNVKEAVEKMGAERIGHGYHVLDDKEIYQFAKEKRLHFETCPTSSIFTNSNKFEDHAIQTFAKDGVSFSLNTDDPGVIDCDLTGEYQVTEERIGLTQHQLMRSVVYGAEAAFLPAKEKAELVKTVKEKLAIFDPTFKF